MTNKEMRNESGNITSTNKLTCLLYMLMRDEITFGALEEFVNEIEDWHEEFVFSNGWIVNYAKNLTKRLNNDNDIKKASAIETISELKSVLSDEELIEMLQLHSKFLIIKKDFKE